MNHRIISKLISQWGLDEKIIRGGRSDRRAVAERMLAVAGLYYAGKFRQFEIAIYIQRSQSQVARYLANFDKIKEENDDIKSKYAKICIK